MKNKSTNILIILFIVVVVGFGLAVAFGNKLTPNKNENVDLTRLTSSKWQWERSLIDGSEVEPKEPGAFELSFDTAEKRVSSLTDCNTLMGSYEAGKDGAISFGQLASTRMFCEGSQDAEYGEMLEKVERFEFIRTGDLVFKWEGGEMTFVKGEGSVKNEESELPDELTAHNWLWEKTVFEDEDEDDIVAKDPKEFELSFDATENRYSSTTDCNGITGGVEVKEDGGLVFGLGASTLMYCEGSQESEYTKSLTTTKGYRISEEGNLILLVEGGEMTFSPKAE